MTTVTMTVTSPTAQIWLAQLERVLDREGWVLTGFFDEPNRRVNLSLLGGAGGKHAGLQISLVGSFDRCSCHLDRIIEVAPTNVRNRNNHTTDVIPIWRQHGLVIRDGLSTLLQAATTHETLRLTE